MNPLHEMIRRLPAGVEFLIVITWAFGLEIFTFILRLGEAAPGDERLLVNGALVSFLVLKSLQLLFISWFLRIRGWTLERFGLRISWRGTAVGVVLFGVAWLTILGAEKLAVALWPAYVQELVARAPKPDAALSMQLLYFTVTVHAIFEMLFIVGYIVAALAPVRGVWTAINVSVVVQVLYHLYAGPIGVVAQIPLGLMYAYLYARTGALWPLILAQVLVSVIGTASGL
jgi:uncharacterized protein